MCGDRRSEVDQARMGEHLIGMCLRQGPYRQQPVATENNSFKTLFSATRPCLCLLISVGI